MKFNLAKAGVLALALALPGVAHAGDSDDFSACDGLKKPKTKDDGMRSVATINVLRDGLNKGALTTLQACTRALASPKLLPTQSLRRAHLLRARAVAYLNLESADLALADLDAAEAAMGDRSQDIFYRRSMGVSLMLLRALTKASLGDMAEAGRLAEEAAALRPYALQVQLGAALIRHAGRPVGQESPSPWRAVERLGSGGSIIMREAEIGNFAGVVALDESGKRGNVDSPSLGQGELTDGLGQLASSLSESAIIAYAYAATGNNEVARDRAKGLCAASSVLSILLSPPKQPASGNAACGGTLAPLVAPLKQLVDARIAVNEGRLADADALISGSTLPVNAQLLDLLKARRAASPEGAVKDMPDLAAKMEATRRLRLGAIGEMLLIAPESERKVIDYEKSRPDVLRGLLGGVFSMGTSLLGGFDRTAGFQSTANPDGTVKIEFVGSTNSGPMVQEMTLLRAAEMAREAKSDHFVIVDRRDYTRYISTRQFGMETSRIPNGFKTELVVRFGDVPGKEESALDAVAVIDELGPLYYDK